MTQTATRTDGHRPSVFVAADYAYVDCIDLYVPDYATPAYKQMVLAKINKYAPLLVGDNRSISQCSVCGARYRYAVIWRHVSGGYITTGEDCATTIDAVQGNAAKRDVRGLIKAAAEYGRKHRAQAAFLASDPLAGDTILWLGDNAETDSFARSLWQAWERYGSLTTRQYAAARRMIDEAPARAAKAAQWAQEREQRALRAAASQWVGEVGQRIVITVTVDFTKYVDNGFSGSTLYAMRDANGNTIRYFGTGAFTAEKGETLTIKATIKAHETYNDTRQTMITRAVRA